MEKFKVWQRNYVTKEVINKENELMVYDTRHREYIYELPESLYKYRKDFSRQIGRLIKVDEFLVFIDGEFKWMNAKAFVPVGYISDDETLILK